MIKETMFYVIAGAISISVIAPVTLVALVLNEEQEQAPEPPFLYEQDRKTWVEIEPTQCFCSPWECEWNGSSVERRSYFPGGIGAPELDQGEAQIIKNYYQRQGITVFHLKSKWTAYAVCAACSCPRGYTLYLLVSDSDVQSMLDFGYRVSIF